MTSKSPVGDISVVTLIRTDTTLDHSQKAEKVWPSSRSSNFLNGVHALRASRRRRGGGAGGCRHGMQTHPQSGGHTQVGTLRFRKNCVSHIDASHSRQPLVKGERLVRYEVNAVMVAPARAALVRGARNAHRADRHGCCMLPRRVCCH